MARFNFEFKATDPIVMAYLHQPEIAGVNTWQTSDKYTFEHHDGHPTGYPLYVRPNGNDDNQNIPKIDTKNKTAAHYPNIHCIANAAKLHVLRNQDREEIERIIHNEWDILAELARRIWEEDGVNAGSPLLTAWTERETADAEPIDVRDMAEFRKVVFGKF